MHQLVNKQNFVHKGVHKSDPETDISVHHIHILFLWGYDLILSSYRVFNVTGITTNFSYFKSAHFLPLFLTRHKPIQRCINILKNNFSEIKINLNFGTVQIFKHYPYLSERRLCDVSRSAPTADKPFYMAVPVHISIN